MLTKALTSIETLAQRFTATIDSRAVNVVGASPSCALPGDKAIAVPRRTSRRNSSMGKSVFVKPNV